MKFKLTLAILFLVFYSCVREDDIYKDEKNSDIEVCFEQEAVLPGVIRIKLRDDVPENIIGLNARGEFRSDIDKVMEIAESIGATDVRNLFPVGGRFEKRHREWGLHLWYEIIFDQNVPVTRAFADFSTVGEFEIVEPARRIRSTTEVPLSELYLTRGGVRVVNAARTDDMPFDDPRLQEQWHYNNDGTVNKGVAGADINLFRAWRVTAGHPEVIVAVMDGGVQYDHPDLAANMWVNPNPTKGDGGQDIHGWNFVTDKPISPVSHGTHVAGTVAAVNNNGIGVAGVAGGTGKNDGVKIMGCQILPGDNKNSPAQAAFVYAADNGAVISQNSWGYEYDRNSRISQSDKLGIDYFIANAGIDEDGNQIGPMKGGVVIFAAGNDGMTAPQYPGAYERVVTVGAIGPDYILTDYTNRGSWIDIVAPGGMMNAGRGYTTADGVLSLNIAGNYAFNEGTSMACPHVSGIAALIVSHYGVNKTGFTPDKLIEILYSSVRDIDVYNPANYGNYGHGLIDAAMALMPDKGIVPGNPSDFSGTWGSDNVTLRWKVPADQYDLEVPEFRIYMGMSEFSNLDPANPGEGIEVFSVGNAVATGSFAEFTIENLEELTSYYFALEALDMYENRSQLIYYNGTTAPQVPPTKEDIPNQYFKGSGSSYSKELNLSEYFTYGGNTGNIVFRAVSADPSVITAEVSGSTLTLTPVTYGASSVTVTAEIPGYEDLTSQFLTMSRDSSREIDLYPNPVVNNLYIRMGEDFSGSAEINIYNSSGRKVVDEKVVLNPFIPTTVNVSRLSGGTYSFELKYGSHTVRQNIIKR